MTQEMQQKLTQRLGELTQQELRLGNLEDDELRQSIERLLDREIAGQYMPIDQRVTVVGDVYARFRGFGPLDAILKDESITEIMVNGPKHIFVEQKGSITMLERTFEDEEQLVQVIRRIVRLAGREVNQSTPIVDTRLPDGGQRQRGASAHRPERAHPDHPEVFPGAHDH